MKWDGDRVRVASGVNSKGFLTTILDWNIIQNFDAERLVSVLNSRLPLVRGSAENFLSLS